MIEILENLEVEKINQGIEFGNYQFQNNEDNVIDSINLATQEKIATVKTCSSLNYQELVLEAQKSFQIWRNVPAPQRGEIIRLIGDALRAKKHALATLVTLETGKSLQESLGEVQEMIDVADFAVGQSRMLYGLTMHSEREKHRMYEQWHPYGVIGIISAFNFPVAVWAWNAFLGAVCGNVSIWKPSEKSALCAVAVNKICNKILQAKKMPPIFGFFLPVSHDVSLDFLEDKRIPLMSFTGSTKTGKYVSQIIAKRLGKSILELGGNNAVIVDEDANIDNAIISVVFGAIGTSGQRCTTTRRVFVHSSHYNEFIAKLINAYKQIKIGDPLDPNNHMGPIIDKDAVNIFTSTISLIKKNNGVIQYGGRIIDQTGFYVEPTIVTDLENDSTILQTESFVPIIYILPYDSLDEAIMLQNSVKQGLSSSIFTNKLQSAELFLSVTGSDCGIANVNIGTSGAEIGGAFGGEKDTGGGRESGSDAWKGYMRRQTSTINWGDNLPLAQGIEFNL